MGADSNTIHIALASDQNYAQGLFVSATSIALHAKRDAALHFHILDGGLKPETIEDLCAALKRINPETGFSVYKVDESLFAGFPAWRGNKMTYARFALPSLMEGVSHVLYCDVDICCLADVGELWQVRDPKILIHAVRDPFVGEIDKHTDWMAKNGYPFDPAKYFCAGVILMNLDLFRSQKAVEKCYEFLQAHPDVMFPDQDALNCLFGDMTSFLDEKWMRFSKTVGSIRDPMLLHYVNDVPWKQSAFATDVSEARLAWFRVYARTSGITFLQALSRFYGRSHAIAVLVGNRLLRRESLVRKMVLWLLVAMGRTEQARYIECHCVD